MSDAVLRRARPADAPRLALLGAATFLHAFAHDHPGDALVAHIATRHSPDWYATALSDPARAGWIVETALGAPVGYALMTPPEIDHPAQATDLELKRLYVLGPWQAGGWGRRLVAAVEDAARARGAERLLLCVYEVNRAAQRFYARCGFADTGLRQDFMVGDVPFTDQIWAKPL